MTARFALILLLVVAVSGNPFANRPAHKRWIHRKITVSPNYKAIPFEKVAKSFVPPRPRYSSGAVKVENCGTAPLYPDVDAAIVGGVEAWPHLFPWQVALSIDKIWFCGGSVISEDWIMTAAHCMEGSKSVSIVAGAHDIYADEPSQVTMVSTDFFTHEDFNHNNFHDDIAMIRLPQKLVFNDYIQPVCLPSPDSEDLGAWVQVNAIGWGSDGYGDPTNKLRTVNLLTISNEDCKKGFGDVIDAGMICTDSTYITGTCSGDSGGSLNYKVSPQTEIRGIVSFGSAAGCLSGYPSAFTRVSHFLDWIQANTGVTS